MERIGVIVIKVNLLTYSKDYLNTLTLAISQCYQSKPSVKALTHCINSGHLSVLEHCTATFEVECSLQTLLQLTRHRHLSFTVQSSRGSKFETMHKSNHADVNLVNVIAIELYNELLNKGIPYEECAYVLPKAINYKLIVTGNFRAWFEYLPKRLCTRAQREHRKMAMDIYKELKKAIPEVFDRSFMNCKNCKETKCTFKE